MTSQLLDIIPNKHHHVEAPALLLNEQTFINHLKHYAHLPWLQSIKEKAWALFNTLPLPSLKDQSWRFSGTQSISLDTFLLPPPPPSPFNEEDHLILSSNYTDSFSGRMIFEDNLLINHDYAPPPLQDQGVIWEPLQTAFEQHPHLIEPLLTQKLTTLGGQKFQYLSIAYAHTGSFLFIPKNVKIKDPFISYHYEKQNQSSLFPFSLFVGEENTEAHFIDIYSSVESNIKGLSIANSIIQAQDNAHLKKISLQNWNEETLSFQFDHTTLEKNAQVETIAINLGSKQARFENQFNIEGEASIANAYSLTIADHNQEFDQRTHQHHRAPNAISNLLYKNALTENSKTIFSGLILVDKNAQKTDAYQTNRNLLLSENAEANSLPGLQIEANDVKCSHGSTSGKLDESDLFYMLSRGLTKNQARELLILGFFEEILEKIKDNQLSDKIRSLIINKLKTHHDLQR